MGGRTRWRRKREPKRTGRGGPGKRDPGTGIGGSYLADGNYRARARGEAAKAGEPQRSTGASAAGGAASHRRRRDVCSGRAGRKERGSAAQAQYSQDRRAVRTITAGNRGDVVATQESDGSNAVAVDARHKEVTPTLAKHSWTRDRAVGDARGGETGGGGGGRKGTGKQ